MISKRWEKQTMHVLRVWAALLTLALLLPVGSAQAASNSITTPDTGGNVGAYTSQALDKGGYPVVGYFDLSNCDLMVPHCGSPNCIVGIIPPVHQHQ